MGKDGGPLLRLSLKLLLVVESPLSLVRRSGKVGYDLGNSRRLFYSVHVLIAFSS